MYQIDSREFKRSMSLLSILGTKSKHPHNCITEVTPILITVDLLGNFTLTTPQGMVFGTEIDDAMGVTTAVVKWSHLKAIKAQVLVRNAISFDVDEHGHAVFTIARKTGAATTYRFPTLVLDWAEFTGASA
jgi:hypothetical protein